MLIAVSGRRIAFHYKKAPNGGANPRSTTMRFSFPVTALSLLGLLPAVLAKPTGTVEARAPSASPYQDPALVSKVTAAYMQAREAAQNGTALGLKSLVAQKVLLRL